MCDVRIDFADQLRQCTLRSSVRPWVNKAIELKSLKLERLAQERLRIAACCDSYPMAPLSELRHERNPKVVVLAPDEKQMCAHDIPPAQTKPLSDRCGPRKGLRVHALSQHDEFGNGGDFD